MWERESECGRERVCVGENWRKSVGEGKCVGERMWERVSGDRERVSGGEREFFERESVWESKRVCGRESVRESVRERG